MFASHQKPQRSAALPDSARFYRSAPFLLVLAALFWGGHWVVARAVISESTPFTLSFWRWTCAVAILAPFAWPHVVRDAAKLRAEWKSIALLSLTGTGLYNGIGYFGVQDTTATNALLIQSVTPALIPVLSYFLVHERIGPRWPCSSTEATCGCSPTCACGPRTPFACAGSRWACTRSASSSR